MVRHLRKSGMDYPQIEEALRIGMMAIKHGVDEKGLEQQHHNQNQQYLLLDLLF